MELCDHPRMNPVSVSPVWQHLLQQVAQQLAGCGADPSRSVVLLPYAQLLPVARQQWALLPQAGMLPRFETTSNWAARRGPFVPGPHDLTVDPAQGLLVAEGLLRSAGQRRDAAWLAGRVREAALQLMPLAAAQAPELRPQWWQGLLPELLGTLGGAEALRYETLVAQVALAWAGSSDYATDGLFAALEQGEIDALVLVRGFQRDALAEALHVRWLALRPDAGFVMDLPGQWREAAGAAVDAGRRTALSDAASSSADGASDRSASGTDAGVALAPVPILLQVARDLEDQAALAAACVQQEVEREQGLVALVDSDRALTRRIRALLEAQKLTVRDETGWKLSTTRAASQVMALLRACAPQAGSDAVLEWLKLAQTVPVVAQADEHPVPAARVQAVEAWLRKQGVARWPSLAAWKRWDDAAAGWVQTVEEWRQALQAPRPLQQWLADLALTLTHTGQLAWLHGDPAGQAVLKAWHAQPGAAELLHDETRWTLEDFTRWVQDVLEAGSFKPPYPLQEQVVILPLSQLLARPFAAVVLPGCDEQRLPAAPEPPGDWTAAQRELLGLPLRAGLQQAQRAAWEHALQLPSVTLLNSLSDGGGEALLPSPLLLESWHLAGEGGRRPMQAGTELRVLRALEKRPVAPPQVVSRALTLSELSASAYDTLRACPYQFFGQQQLKLREVPELDHALEKRDFGNWLHEVLALFHKRWQQLDVADPGLEQLVQWMDQAAQDALRSEGLDEVDFVPYQSVWPRLRDGYLHWLLGEHAATQARFDAAEQWRERSLREVFAALQADMPADPEQPALQAADIPDVRLRGCLDRVDRLLLPPDDDGTAPQWLLLDYKSEAAAKTSERIKRPDEDTQLAFYATLLAPEPVQVAYVNVGESGETKLYPHQEVHQLTTQLVHGMARDLQGIARGTPLQALGRGGRCDYCAMRGLCRRDFWDEEEQA